MMSSGINMNINGSSSGNFPFTATQWQELEHQALIYKYMISGLPIPPDLLFSVRRSFDSSLSSTLLLQQPHQQVGWNSFQMGYGRKIDPEPGRCRRTDGKKWRCSKEAYTDSKYCERHMHRGKNRSRKPVEITLNSPTKPINSAIIAQNTPSSLFSPSNSTPLSSMTFVDTPPSYGYETNPFLHPHSSKSHGIDFSSQEKERDYRYTYGVKEDIGEHPFFSESSGSVRDYSVSRPSNLGYPFLHLNDASKQQKQDHYAHIVDFDYQREMPTKLDRDDIKPQQVMHRFFDEMPKSKYSWEENSPNCSGSSTTQLSISTPNSSYDFFMDHKW